VRQPRTKRHIFGRLRPASVNRACFRRRYIVKTKSRAPKPSATFPIEGLAHSRQDVCRVAEICPPGLVYRLRRKGPRSNSAPVSFPGRRGGRSAKDTTL